MGGFFYVLFVRNWFYMIGIMLVSKENIVDKFRNKDYVNIFIYMFNFILLNSFELFFIFGEILNVLLFNLYI